MLNITKENIISTTKKLILKNGYYKTTVQSITKELGISKGSFYNFFNSKEDLIIELMNEKFNNNLSIMSSIFSKDTDNSINDYIKYNVNFINKDIEFILLIIILIKNKEEINSNILEKFNNFQLKRKNQIMDLLNKNIKEIEIKDEKDLEKYSIFIMDIIDSFYIHKFFPNLTKIIKIDIENIKNIISSINFDYETNFLTKIILKIIKK